MGHLACVDPSLGFSFDIPLLAALGLTELASRLPRRPVGGRKRSIITMDRQQEGAGQSSLPDSLHDHIVTASHQPEQSRPGSRASARSSGSHIIPPIPPEPQEPSPTDLPTAFPLRLANFRPLPYRPHSAGAGPGVEGLEGEGSSSIHHGSSPVGVTDPRNYVYRPGSMSIAPTAEARLRPVRTWNVGGAGRSASPPGDRHVYDLGSSPGSDDHLYTADVPPVRTDIGSLRPMRGRRAGSSDSGPRYGGRGTYIVSSPVDFSGSPSSRLGLNTFREEFVMGYDRYPGIGEPSSSRPIRRRTTSALSMQRHRSVPHEGSSTSGRSEYGQEPVPSSASSSGSPSTTVYPELHLPHEGPLGSYDGEESPSTSAVGVVDPSTVQGTSYSTPAAAPSVGGTTNTRKGKRRQREKDDESVGADPDTAPPQKKTRKTKTEVACNFCRKRKLRCDGNRPCKSCRTRKNGSDEPCKYEPFARRRGPGKAKKGSKKQGLHTPPDPRMVLRLITPSESLQPPGRPGRSVTEHSATPGTPPLTVDHTLLMSNMSIQGEPLEAPSHRYPPLPLPAPGRSRMGAHQAGSVSVPQSSFTPVLPDQVLDMQGRFQRAGGYASRRPPHSREHDG